MAAIIATFPARSDNYGYLVHDEGTGRTAAIDAPEEAAIVKALEENGWALTDIFITHHHGDHTEAILPLKARYGATVTGPEAEQTRIEGLDLTVKAGDSVVLGDTVFHIYATPGHTLGHIVYHDPRGKALFCGDALFSLGCGKMIEGEPVSMWDGLKALRGLDPETKVYFGHEYTLANARFALSIDPDNTALQTRAAEAEALRARERPTSPTRLGDEAIANPFLRADDEGLAAAMGLSGRPAHEVFAAIRRAKDGFRG